MHGSRSKIPSKRSLQAALRGVKGLINVYLLAISYLAQNVYFVKHRARFHNKSSSHVAEAIIVQVAALETIILFVS
jgi:hypothetical protein